MKVKEEELQQAGYSVARHVLIDDYSTATGLDRFDKDNFLQQLKKHQVEPDITVLESTLVDVCNELVSKITNKTLRKSLISYYKTRKIWPCSMCVAAWYLVRLGVIQHKELVSTSNRIVSILPDRFKTPELAAKDIIEATEFKDYIKNIEVIFFDSSFTNYSQWAEFDAEEYATRNYLQRVLPEDKTIISFVADYLADNCDAGSLDNVADIGTGPNLYPTLLAKPFISKTGTVHLVEPVKNNRDFLEYTIKHPNTWNSFGKLLSIKNPKLYGVSAKVPNNIVVQDGDIFDLQEDSYDLVMAFFVAESITDDPNKVTKAMNSLKAAVKPGGVLLTAHMLGSRGYFAGILTSFPATPITKSDIKEYYSNFVDTKILTTSHNQDYEPRKGYKGMAVAAGKKPNS